MREEMNNKKIIESTIVMARISEDLPKNINQHLHDGWDLYGNVFVDEDEWFCVLMVKYD